MSLTGGARLGPYEIVSPLGAGGMGEVYRAKDARLNRTVAIKILSDESAADADRRDRFEREAKAISALDHPNICALYDVGEHEGTYFLVMPCLEGQTLADRLAKGALPPDQAIKYGIEIATALDAAHRHGIIHRDLKPGNIMLTKTGVKLLDFGLAKLKKASGPLTFSGITDLAGGTATTNARPGTGVGTLLGTMPYMAPEQIEGRDVDARSDIFSLGAVIYEMVTGQRAFKGDSPASVIGAILKDEPKPMKTVQPLTPAALDHVVTTCLAKDPDERWQSAADIARELKWAMQLGTATGAAPSRRLVSGFWAGAAVATLLLITVGMIGGPLLNTPSTAPAVVRFPLVPPPNAEFVGTRSSVPITQVAVSPDGSQLAFVAAETTKRAVLWVRNLDDVSPKALAGTENAQDPFWSPDSQSLGFFADGRLKRVDVATSRVQEITEASFSSRGGAWSPDGTIVFGDASAGLSRVSASGGQVSRLTSIGEGQSGNSHRWPMFLPDGRHFLYFSRGESEQRGIYVSSLDGAPAKRILESVMSGVYANGHLLAIRNSTLLAFPFDIGRLEVVGDPVLITSQIGGSSTQQAPIAVSQTGVLAYGGGLQETNQLRWFSRNGAPLGVPLQTGNFVQFSLSPDESALALSKVDPLTNTADLWLVDLQRLTPTRLTLDPMNDMGVVWSPDGKQLVFRSDRFGGNFLFGWSLVGDARENVLVRSDISNPTDWSSDGGHVIFHQTVAQGGIDIAAVRMSDRTVVPVIRTRYNEYDGRLSHDGKWLAYVSEESGTPEVYVQPFPPTGRKWAVSANGGAEPRWRKDGRELFYMSADRRLMSVPVTTNGDFRAGIPTALFQTETSAFAISYRSQLAVSGDGQRFLINTGPEGSALPAITVVLNWTTALAKK